MDKPQRWIITSKWLKIKDMYEKGTNGSKEFGTNFPIGGELDKMVYDFIDDLGTLTLKFGWDSIIEEVKMDLWKERIWSLAANAGLMYNSVWDIEEEEVDYQEDQLLPLVEFSEIEEQEPTREDINNIERYLKNIIK